MYFAIVRDGQTPREASGLARRIFTAEGRLDETFGRNLMWNRDSAIYEWEHGEEMGAELIEISEAEARTLIERFREKWSSER